MLEKFLREELAGKYELYCSYDFHTNSVVVEMRDGVLRNRRIVSMKKIVYIKQPILEVYIVEMLREMTNEIDEYRAKETERLKEGFYA